MILLKSDKVKFIRNVSIWFYLIFFIFSFGCSPEEESYAIIIPEDANFQEKLAAKEIRRYLYARTGELLRIDHIKGNKTALKKAIIIADLKHASLVHGFNETNFPEIKDISSQGYTIQKRTGSDSQQLWIIGGTDFGVIYGAYHFLENMGIGFYLHDDIIPDEKIDLIIPDLNISRDPLFDLRGDTSLLRIPSQDQSYIGGNSGYRSSIKNLLTSLKKGMEHVS